MGPRPRSQRAWSTVLQAPTNAGPIDAFGIFDASSSKFAITRYNGASSAAGRAPASTSPAEWFGAFFVGGISSRGSIDGGVTARRHIAWLIARRHVQDSCTGGRRIGGGTRCRGDIGGRGGFRGNTAHETQQTEWKQ